MSRFSLGLSPCSQALRAWIARLHPVAGAADVQVDLVIAPVACDPRGLRQFRRIRTTQLQGHRMFGGVVIQQPGPVAMNDGGCRDHFRIKQGPAGHEPVKDAAMPVRPVHHGSDGQRRCVRDKGFHHLTNAQKEKVVGDNGFEPLTSSM